MALKGGRFARAAVAPSAAAVVRELGGEELGAIGIDIPIGLPVLAEGSRRECDALARARLRRRASTVFDALPEEVLRCETYAEARSLAVSRWGRSVSSQAYNLRSKILEVAEALGRGGSLSLLSNRVHEVHPELSFAAMNGGEAVGESKRTSEGAERRAGLLEQVGVVLDASAAARGVAGVASDDVLDAAAIAWSAARIAAGEGAVFGPDSGPSIHF